MNKYIAQILYSKNRPNIDTRAIDYDLAALLYAQMLKPWCKPIEAGRAMDFLWCHRYRVGAEYIVRASVHAMKQGGTFAESGAVLAAQAIAMERRAVLPSMFSEMDLDQLRVGIRDFASTHTVGDPMAQRLILQAAFDEEAITDDWRALLDNLDDEAQSTNDG